jgi:pimeloyl-ACP methyl ester carboxylesterase
VVYGLDVPALPLLVVLWALAALAAGRLSLARSPAATSRAATATLGLVGVAIVVAVVYLVQILGGRAWLIDRDEVWLHAALTVLPAVISGACSGPRLVRVRQAARAAAHAAEQAAGRLDADVGVHLRRTATDPVLSGPVTAAAIAAAVNLYAAVVPHEQLTGRTLAPPLLLLVAATAVLLATQHRRRHLVIAGLNRARHRRERVVRAAISGGVVLGLIVGLATAAMTTSTVPGYDAAQQAAVRERAAATSVRTGMVTTEGDDLYFEVRGSGAPLLMISGGNGDAGFFTYPAALLADEYQVITYDRRGNSRSSRHHPEAFDIAQQARDAVAVLRAAGHRSAAVFGNSGGAIIALEMAARHPGAVTMVVAHEPVALTVLPDAERWLALFDTLDGIARTAGPGAAMFVFALSVGIPFQAYASVPADFSARVAENQDFFVNAEMVTFVRYRPDLAAIAARRIPVTFAVGATTRATNRYYGRPATVLAERLPARLAVFPGHHQSYFDLAVPWTDALRAALHVMRAESR